MKNLTPSNILAHQKMKITKLLDAIIPKSGINLILNLALTSNLFDHGTTIDENGYPLHPKGRTTFVHLPTDEIGNFGKVGFSKHSAISYAGANRTWKITRYFCLGVLTCDNTACTWAGAPPTCWKKWKHLPKTVQKMTCPGLPGHCLGKVSHQRCEDAAIRIDQHCKGEVCWGGGEEPKSRCFQAQGKATTNGDAPFKCVSSIHPAYQNKDRVAYYRRRLLVAMGLTPDKLGGGIGDKFILDMLGWSTKGLLIISSSFMPGNEHFTFQSSWMAERLLAQDKDNKLLGSTHLDSRTDRSILQDSLRQFLPAVQVTMTHTERDALACQVVDFSAAQTNGFAYAYMEVFREPDKQTAIDKLRGCKEHYRQSIKRVKVNRTVILGHEEEPFRQACRDLLTPPVPGGLTHEQQVDTIYRRFPKVRKWLDWWCMADVSAMIFRTHKPLLEDSPDPLPETPNAQESMHQLYYMISKGKTCLMVGMVELYSFVHSLEDDWNAMMKGVSISYGSQKPKDIGLSMGLVPKTKRNHQAPNDGRPPDTSDTLSNGPTKKAKLGRPPNSGNFDKNQFLSFPSYQSHCGTGISGRQKDLFSFMVNHFTSRSTYELTLKGTIASILTNGKNKLFNYATEKYPGQFPPGLFASCDFFLEVMLDPFLHQSRQPRQLFVVNEHRDFTCELQPNVKQDHPNRHERLMHVIHVKPAMFGENRIPYSDVTKLIDLWQTTGVRTVSGIICKRCCMSQPSIASTSLKKKKRQLKKINSDISVVSNPSPPDQSLHRLYETSSLCFDDSPPPLHLYFYLDIATLPENSHEQSDFMGTTDWPFNLTVGGAIYTLMSWGYWNGTHYWSKVNRTSSGVTGTWLQNNADNAGWARLMSVNPSTIAGPSDGTSWLMYSRTWTHDESEYVNNAIENIAKDHPNHLAS
ncbi:hypothetical protein PSHT_13608 [Puccinia striiformis]|uniref:GCM domain-containing protein n=1 Tax=Puccinia striiformis TaxID=27350 RepID=A0A2S4UQ00_9BASI|nr:hypothetical protein PSHT_13608 [Puccinia striiformis]